MGAAKRKEENVIRVLKNMLQLMDKGNPAMFFWLDKGKMQYFGSKNTLDYFETKMDTTLKESIHTVMMADLLNPDGASISPDIIPFNEQASALYKNLTAVNPLIEVPKLPCALSLMNKKQKIGYLSNLVVLEAKHDGVKRLIYGSDEWRPSFWPEHIWSWKQVQTRLWKIKDHMYSGEGNYVEFLNRTIEGYLTLHDLSPDDHVETCVPVRVIERKRRIRGLHSMQKIVYHHSVCRDDGESNRNCDLGQTQTSTMYVDVDANVNELCGWSSSNTSPEISDSDFHSRSSCNKPAIENEFDSMIGSNEVFTYLPGHLLSVAPNFISQLNSGGGPCLYKSVAQHITESNPGIPPCSYLELRWFVHEAIIANWKYLEPHSCFPFTAQIGTGDSRTLRVINSSSEYHEFLLTQESLESYNETEIDLLILADVLKTSIHVLAYNLPAGQGLNGEGYFWHNPYLGKGIVKSPIKYACDGQPLYLLNDHLVHWSRMVVVSTTDDYGSVDMEIDDQTNWSSSIGSSECQSSVIIPLDTINGKVADGLIDVTVPLCLPLSTDESCVSNKIAINTGSLNSCRLIDHVSEGAKQPPAIENSRFLSISSSHAKSNQAVATDSDEAIESKENEENNVCELGKSFNDDRDSQSTHCQVACDSRSRANVLVMEELICTQDLQKQSLNVEFNLTDSIAVSSTGLGVSKIKGSNDFIEPPSDDLQLSTYSCGQVGAMMKNKHDRSVKFKPDLFFKFQIKERSIFELLAPPSKQEVEKEKELDELDRTIVLRKVEHEERMARLDKSIVQEKERFARLKERLKLNRIDRNVLQNTSVEEILQVFDEIKDSIAGIFKGDIYSKRRHLYFKDVYSREQLNEKVIIHPFNDEQYEAVFRELKKLWLNDAKDRQKNDDFVWKVIVPETMIRVGLLIYPLCLILYL